MLNSKIVTCRPVSDILCSYDVAVFCKVRMCRTGVHVQLLKPKLAVRKELRAGISLAGTNITAAGFHKPTLFNVVAVQK